MKVVGHISNIFLSPTQTFVYQQIKKNRWFQNVVFTRNRINHHSFPHKAIVKFRNSNDLAEGLKEKRVDVLHAHFGPNALWALPAKNKLGIPMLTFIHGYDASKFPHATKENLQKYQRLFRDGELFAVPSLAIKQELISLGCPEKKIKVSHLGIEVEKIQFKPRVNHEGPIRLVSVGRLVEKKGHRYLIEALSLIQERMPNYHLKIIGEGDLYQDLERLIRRLGLEKNVLLLGKKTHQEVFEELEKADIFCLASTTAKDGDMEGLPVSILEAQAMGLPVVSTRHSGIPEGVVEGKSALLAEEKNAADLANKLLGLMEAPDCWEEFGFTGRHWVEEHFHADKQARELKQLYEELIKGGRPNKK